MDVPIGLHARKGRIEVVFTDRLDERSASEPANYSVRVWSLKRTANYGSDHIGERSIKVASARLGSDGRTVALEIPDLRPTWCIEVTYAIRDASGGRVEGSIDGTIHRLGE